jgi:hypothetical protein
MCLGLRVSEILALKWSDFDFEEGTLMVTRGTVHARIGRVKTEYSEDEMPLHPAFAKILSAWQPRCTVTQEDWVFPNPNTGGVWHSSVLQGDILVPACCWDRTDRSLSPRVRRLLPMWTASRRPRMARPRRGTRARLRKRR